MVEEIFRWRPVPLRQRCDRCREEARVVLDQLFLCAACFLVETKKRFGDKNQDRPDFEQTSASTDELRRLSKR